MKIIIQNGKIAATALDEYTLTGNEQAVIQAPPDFDVTRMAEYGYDASTGTLTKPWEVRENAPMVTFSMVGIGPNADKASIRGAKATILYILDPTTKDPLNGVCGTVEVTVGGKVLDGTGGLPSFDHAFGMPFQALDAYGKPAGTPIKKLVQFTKGRATVDFIPEAPCDWVVTQETISQGLQADESLRLASTVLIVAVKP